MSEVISSRKTSIIARGFETVIGNRVAFEIPGGDRAV